MAYTFADGEILTAEKVNSYLVNPNDSGWLTSGITWMNGWSLYPSDTYGWKPFSYRIIGEMVYASGLVKATNAGSGAALVMRMPQPLWPKSNWRGYGDYDISMLSASYPDAAGYIRINTGAWAAGGAVGLQIAYPLN